MSETTFIEQVMATAKRFGWLVHHDFRSARRMERHGRVFYAKSADAGFPDLVLLHPERHLLAFVECKDNKKPTTVEQAEWIAALRAAVSLQAGMTMNFYVGIWRPRDLDGINLYLTTGSRSLLPT